MFTPNILYLVILSFIFFLFILIRRIKSAENVKITSLIRDITESVVFIREKIFSRAFLMSLVIIFTVALGGCDIIGYRIGLRGG